MRPLPDETLAEAVELVSTHGGIRQASVASGIPYGTLHRRITNAAERGLMGFKPVLPGFRVAQTTDEQAPDGTTLRRFIQQKPEHGEQFAIPTGHVVKGVSAFVDADGREIAKWVKTREDRLDHAAVAEWLKTAFMDYAPAAPIAPRPAVTAPELLTLIPLADWHIGMFAWHRESSENWDLKIAERTIGEATENLIAQTQPSGHAIVLGGGDLIHSDNNENKTARSGNVLQVDGRYDKVVGVAGRLVARTIDAALRHHERVTVRVLKGNHDEHASVAVAYFLLGWFRNEPRVAVDVDPSLFWWHRFGRVMLGATHGHTVKIQEMPQIMAHRRAEDWGATRYRYAHGFHLHHTAKFATEGGGVICETHQAPIPQDAWHYGSGYLSGRSVQAVTYHREFGEVGRARVAIMDGETK